MYKKDNNKKCWVILMMASDKEDNKVQGCTFPKCMCVTITPKIYFM